MNLGAVDISPYHGNGGTLQCTAYNTVLAQTVYSADAQGGDFNGGFVQFARSSFLSPQVLFSANGSGAGNGGTISLDMTGHSFGGDVVVSATGGSPGSATGNGGQLSFSGLAAGSTVSPANFNIFPLGINGNGPRLYADLNNVVISGSLIFDGTGTGDGGIVWIQSPSAIAVGPGTTGSGVDGVISVNSANGRGGEITVISNASSVTLSAPDSVSAVGLTGGKITLTQAQYWLATGNISLGDNLLAVGPGGSISINALGLTWAGGGPLRLSSPGGDVSLQTNNPTSNWRGSR